MSVHIHELPEWPRFHWDRDSVHRKLAEVRHRQGRLIGRMESLGLGLRQEAVLVTLTEDVVKSSEIEGERLDSGLVRASVAQRLGMDEGGPSHADDRVDGIVELLLDATGSFGAPLTAERLFGWHAALFPGGRSGLGKIRTGTWRDGSAGPMQVVSGRIGRERVHFEAPVAERVPHEMAGFLTWFEGSREEDWVIKAALAHLWFITIHPFADGNGRIARAISDMALARSEASSQRFYSMSAEIRRQRAGYYEVLERTQKGSLEVTVWMDWFLDCLGGAIDGAEAMLIHVLRKARFWDAARTSSMNDRQRLVLGLLLEDFEGKLTSSKWAKLAGCSVDTALRDISELVDRGVLVKGPASGRGTSYVLGGV